MKKQKTLLNIKIRAIAIALVATLASLTLLLTAHTTSASNKAPDLASIYTPEIYRPVTTIKSNVSDVPIKSYIFITSDNRPVEVQYSFPNNPDYAELKIVIVMPGMTRDPDGRYMRAFSYLSKVENICVITPKFSEKDFSTSEYQRVNISSAIRYEDWTFNKVDAMFEDFVRRFDLTTEKYILYGHSAGGQFAHRTAIFSRSEHIDYVIAASAGSYTFLDENTNYFKSLKAYKDTVLTNLCTRKVYVLTGNKDNDPNAENFTPSEQGNSRHEKALNFCKSTLAYAIENRVYYNWETLVMDDVGHNVRLNIPYVLDIIIGEYSSKTEAINNRISAYYEAAGISVMSGWAKTEIRKGMGILRAYPQLKFIM